jgi:hypothetical protein
MTQTADSPPKRGPRDLRQLASRRGLALMPSSTAGRFHLVRREGNWTVLAQVPLDDVEAFLTDLDGRVGHWF